MPYEVPSDWLERGLSESQRKKLTKNAVQHDRWDRADWDEMNTEVPQLAAAHEALADFTPTGGPASADSFWSLLKAAPRVEEEQRMQPDHIINRIVNEELQEAPELKRLRRFSVNDPVQASLSFAEIEPDVEVIFDKLEQERKQAEEFQKTLQDLAAASGEADQLEQDIDAVFDRMERLANGEEPCPECGGSGEVPDPDAGDGQDGQDGDGTIPCEACDGTGTQPGDGQGQGTGQSQPGGHQGGGAGGGGSQASQELTDELREKLNQQQKDLDAVRDKVRELQQQAQDQAGQMGDALEKARPGVAAQIREAIVKAADSAQELVDRAMAWGLDPGSLTKMNAEERLALAKKLQSDRFRRIADLFGPMKNLMLSEQQRKTTHVKEEIFDVETGNDVARLLSSELASIRHPLLRRNFMRKFANRSLLQYALQGTERLARGGIILCEDGSGSMAGDRELWAKAVMLCLLDLAKRQSRTMHVVHFGGPGFIKRFDFVQPSDFSFDRVVECAEFFANGGTDFQTPMKEALGILQDEFAKTGGVKADVVFVTDDECYVSDEFMTEYLDEMHRMDATTWGISATGHRPGKDGALHAMSEGKTAAVTDFLSGGDVRQVFRGV